MKPIYLLIALTASASAWAQLPFSDGRYEGQSVCVDQKGKSETAKASLTISGGILSWEYIYPDHKASASVTLSLSADSRIYDVFMAGVKSGDGYCGKEACHLSFGFPNEKITEEATLIRVGNSIHLLGSALFSEPVEKVICEESYSN